jgi:nucleoside-diphosphate-sugar epimerase
MNVLVTGGCGFIGLKFAKRLLEKNHSVYLMDVNAEPLKKQPGLGKITFIPGTVTCQAHLVNTLKEHKIQWLAHLAARLSAPSEEDPWSTFEVNVRGLYHALEAARICGVERFVFTSSLASYGLHLPPIVDDVTIQRPIGMYGVTKVFGEQLGAFYRRRFGLDFRCIRFAQIIGPGVKTPGVAQCMPMVIEAAAKGEPFEMWIEEESTMPLLYYKDGIEALSCLTHAPKENILTISYNLAGIKTSAAELVRSIRAIVPNSKINFAPDPAKVAIVKTIPSDIDDSRLRQETGYQPMFDLDSAVKDFIQEVRSGKA